MDNKNVTPKTKNKSGKKDVLLYALLAVFAVAFVVSMVFIVKYFVEAGKEKDMRNPEIGSILDDTEKTMNDIWTRPTDSPDDTTTVTVVETTDKTPQDTTTNMPTDTTSVTDQPTQTEPPVETEPPIQYSEKFLEIRKKIQEMSAQYPDIFGYISIPSLDINYPLLHRPSDHTNSYYLRRAYDGTDLVSGSIFMDYRCVKNIPSNRNVVIYGHNMRSGSMFGPLQMVYYKQTEFEDAEIIVATMDAIYTYKVFSVYRTNADNNYCQTYFPSSEQYLAFLNRITEASRYDAEIELFSGDKIITLSTCTNLTSNGRYAVHGVLVKIEN